MRGGRSWGSDWPRDGGPDRALGGGGSVSAGRGGDAVPASSVTDRRSRVILGVPPVGNRIPARVFSAVAMPWGRGKSTSAVGCWVLDRVRDSRELLIGRVSVVTGSSASVSGGHRWRRRGCRCPGPGSRSPESSATGGVALSSPSSGCRRQPLTGGGCDRRPVAGGTVDQRGKRGRSQRERQVALHHRHRFHRVTSPATGLL